MIQLPEYLKMAGGNIEALRKVEREVLQSIRYSPSTILAPATFMEVLMQKSLLANNHDKKPSAGGAKGGGPRNNNSGGSSRACLDYNSEKGCSRNVCKFAHKCSKCGGAHSKTACTQK